MKHYIPSERLALFVSILIAIQILLSLAAMGSSFLQVELLTRARLPGSITEAEASLNDQREMLIGIVAIVMAIISGIVFLWYSARANYNARALGAEDLTYTPGWTVGYYFVPIYNLWRPMQILQEIWKASAPEPGRWQDRPGSQLIAWWWTTRILNLVIDRISIGMMRSGGGGPDAIDQLIMSTWVQLSSEFLSVVSFALSWFLVRKLQERQVKRFELIGEPHAIQCPSCGEVLRDQVHEDSLCPVCGTRVPLEVVPT